MKKGTRIEIYKNLQWKHLVLRDNDAIKYNAVINKVGEVSTREISHTNTFSLAPVWQNTQALGLNIFNAKDLAKALNTKYRAKYYVEDKLFQEGFLVINNTKGGTIQVNFIDEALDITEKWGSTTYQELLRDDTLAFPLDYQNAINELFEYDMDKTAVLTPLSEVGTRGHNLCLFPNNLNTIGDVFQLDENENRIDDAFNPYQSRPVFNAISLFDLATVGYGYTPIFDPSVDWQKIMRTYMVDKGLLESANGNNGIQQIQHPTVSSAGSPFYVDPPDFGAPIQTYTIKHLYDFSAGVSKKPGQVENFSEPVLFQTFTGAPFYPPPSQPWLNENVIFTPDVQAGNVGEINIKGDTVVTSTNGDFTDITIIGIWKNITLGSPTVDSVLAQRDFNGNITGPLVENTPITATQFDVTLDKSVLDTVPSGADPDGLVGISVIVSKTFLNGGVFNMGNLQVTETYLPVGVVAYDDYGQYLPDIVDLTHAAPKETIKTLLSGIMHKEGILMDIDNKNREVKFFTYGAYEQQKFDGNFSDWSKYLQKYDPLLHNTNYGNAYAIKNRIGLNTPYNGNTSDIILENQGEDSKYKDFTTNYLQKFKDISNVKEVLNTNTPYLEFENKGLGLVEYGGNLGQLSQRRANGSVQGDFTGLAAMINVNGSILPNGVVEWYKLVDEAIRVDAQFLFPSDVIKQLDLSEPVFIEGMGGWYIIEEVSEYENQGTPVEVKLIKLIDDLRGLGTGPSQGDPPVDPEINLVSSSGQPNGVSSFVYFISNHVTFYGYIPNSATIKAVQYDGDPNSGGVPTGFEINQSVDIPPYQNIPSHMPGTIPLGDMEGWYVIQVTDGDDPLLVSNTQTVYLGDNTVEPESINCIVVNDISGTSSTVLYSVENPSSVVTYMDIEWQRFNSEGDTPLGPINTVNLPVSPLSGSVVIDFGEIGFYKVTLKTNIGDSPEPTYMNGVWVVY